MEITNGLKGRFCKLYGIPINLYEEPYFQSRLELLDKQYGAVEKYKEFLDSIAEFKTEQDYYEHYNKVKDSAISAVKNNATFQQFNEIDMSGFNSVIKKYQLPSKPIYKPSFDGKHFISIDMKQANFSTLYNFDNTMFDGAKTWEEYIGRFTERKELIESKYMRQRIFGECNPKRQITYQKYLMCKLLAFLLVGIPEKDIVFFSHDEIVIDDTEKTYIYYPFVKECINKYNISTNVKMRIERFQLKHLGEDVGYAKVYDNESRFDLKCVDSDYIPMIFRFIQTGRILEEDLAFFYKGTTAKFAKIPNQVRTMQRRYRITQTMFEMRHTIEDMLSHNRSCPAWDSMEFNEAYDHLKKGKKIKLPEWNGYWYWSDDRKTIMIHRENGKELDIRDTKNTEYTFDCITRNDWMVIKDE